MYSSDFNISQEEADAMRLRYLKKELSQLKQKRNRMLTLKLTSSISERWFVSDIMADIDKEITKIQKNISFISRRKDDNTYNKITHDEIKERVKIRDILDMFGVAHDMHNRFKLRNERTPSAHFNTDKNLWYDFGASEGGSVIDLYIKLRKCDLSTALKELSQKCG